MHNLETTVASLPFVITRLDRVIHMVKVQLNRVWYFNASAYLHRPLIPNRPRIVWISRSNHVATFYVALVHTGNDGVEEKG